MILKSLALKNYRNYGELNINLNSRLNIIIGNNAQGKTNLLESIYFLSLTKSFISINDKFLIKNNEKFSVVRGTIIDDNDLEKKLEVLINEKGKITKINSKMINKVSDYIFNLKVIIFSPDNIKMFKDAPNVRRKFLNVELSQLYSKYFVCLTNFNKLLKQRNEYLKIAKNGKVDFEYLNIIDGQFAKFAVSLISYRLSFISDINNIIDSIYYSISGFEGLKIKYISSFGDSFNNNISEDFILEQLRHNLDKDLMLGLTSIGPHRDDFQVYLNNDNLAIYGSQGQNRLAVIALKISEIQLFRDKLNINPILLFDDLFSELDSLKKNNIIKYLLNSNQTIITTTDINSISDKLVDNATIFTIDNGKVINN